MLLPPPPQKKKKNFFLGGKERIESRRFILSLSLFLCGDVNGRREKERGDIKRRRVEERETERRPGDKDRVDISSLYTHLINFPTLTRCRKTLNQILVLSKK